MTFKVVVQILVWWNLVVHRRWTAVCVSDFFKIVMWNVPGCWKALFSGAVYRNFMLCEGAVIRPHGDSLDWQQQTMNCFPIANSMWSWMSVGVMFPAMRCSVVAHCSPYLQNARQGFHLKLATKICELVLNLRIEHWTGQQQTKWSHTKSCITKSSVCKRETQLDQS